MLNLAIIRQVQVAPWARRLCGLQPKPSCAQRDADAVQVTHANAAKLDRAADLGPADVAVPSIGGLASLPEESTDEAVHLPKDGSCSDMAIKMWVGIAQ